MAVSAAMAAISTAVAAASGTLMFASIAAHFLIATAMGAALNALTPKPKLGAGSNGYSINGESGSALDHQIIYGETRTGGVRIYDSSTGGRNQFLHRVLAFAGHEIDSYQEIYLNDEVVTLDGSGNVTSPSRYDGKVRIKKYFGTTVQTADPDLVSETNTLTDGVWTSNHRLQGIAYIYVRFQYDADAFPNGIPSLSCVIRGKKVFDPRTSTTVWGSNPALCIRDYLTSEYGLAQSSGRIDDSLVIAAANICDQTVEGESRYSCNGAFTTNAGPSEVLTNILTSMGGLLWYGQGNWRVKASAWIEPAVTFDEGDLRSGISLSTRHSRRDNFNSVKGTFRGAESNWQPADYPEVSDPAFLSADNGLVNVLDFGLPFTSSSLTAQRIARIALNRNREQLTFSASFGMRGFQVQVGDFIYLNNSRFGFVNKPFEVTEWTFGLTDGLDIQARMTLREISEGVFTGATGAVFEANNTTLPNGFRPVPFGLSLTSQVRVVNEHLTNVIFAEVTSSEPFNIDRVEVQFKKSSDTNWKIAGVGDLGVFEILDTEDETYDIRARTYSFLGIRSDFETQTNFVVAGLAEPPANVTGLTAEINGASVHLEWEPVPDLDLSFYRIRHATEETGASWANATTAVDKVPRPANSVTVPAKPGTYMIRAFDKTGNASGEYTSVVIPADALESFTNSLTQTDDPTFTGTKTDCSVSSSTLIITSVTGTAPFLATYLFSNYIDTGAVRRFRSRIDLTNVRQDNSSGLWDDIPGLFDTLPGNFDDFTGDAQFDDTNIITYISTTEDNPAGTPTWTNYQKFRAGDYYARAARFKIELTSNATNVTPSIAQLDAIVEYN
tara:strand:+ start:2830 stop:5346 length:2517 start_codon:yes stop_codon:yes gene_type:complete